MIRTYRQLLTAIHERPEVNNFGPDGFNSDLEELAAEAEKQGLISIVIGWGEDEYYRLTNKGREYIGVPREIGVLKRLVSFACQSINRT